MSQLVAPEAGSTPTPFELVGSGLNVYESTEIVEGRVRWLETPDDVISFVQDGQGVEETIVVVRGGTTTFLTMALNAGVRGVITLQGAPESHLGILSREYGIPCLMSVNFEKGIRTSRGETIPANGVRVRLDVTQRPRGTVSVELGAPVDDTPPADDAPGMTPEQMAQIQLLLEKFGGVVPHGSQGDAVMQSEMKTRVLYLDDVSTHRKLTLEEANELIRYLTWNEWDALAARATEGESGLIPRQEYEAMGILNCWFKHPEWLRVIEDRIGVDGIIEIGARGRHEIGTKLNMLHFWAIGTATSFGRGIALEMKLHDADYKSDTVVDGLETVRRLFKGLWGGGAMLTSMREYKAPILDESWITRFTADRISLADSAARSTFQKFNGATELMGFLLHFDNRLGLGDHGPYPTADGGFVLVRDLFINEPAFPWSNATKGLPYAVTIAMFFGPGSGIETQMTDLSTVFTTPANYLPGVSGVSVYTRQKFDSPMDELRTLTLDDMAALRDDCERQSTVLFKQIAGMSKREKILAGATVYAAGFVLPVARAAGMYDELVNDHRLFELHPAVEASYDIIIGGVATEMIPRLFLTGSWGNPVPDQTDIPPSDTSAELSVLHTLKVRGFATAEQITESNFLDFSSIEEVLAAATERGYVKYRGGRITGYMLTQIGKARRALLQADSVTSGEIAKLTPAYDSFLAPNRAFKQLTTDWQLSVTKESSADEFINRLEDIHRGVSDVIASATVVQARFETYQGRFERALSAVKGGDLDALAKPMSGSYHDVWMELHEDLLTTLGRERTDDDE